MARAGVRLVDTLKNDFLPNGDVFAAPDLLNDPCTVKVIEEDFVAALPPVYVNLVIDQATAVGVPGFRHFPD